MFAAAMIFATPNVECSIYATCKRISQKLLRNVLKFLNVIYDGSKATKFKVIRCNCEELVLQGDEGPQDVRVINSYPSKVGFLFDVLNCLLIHFIYIFLCHQYIYIIILFVTFLRAPFSRHCHSIPCCCPTTVAGSP